MGKENVEYFSISNDLSGAGLSWCSARRVNTSVPLRQRPNLFSHLFSWRPQVLPGTRPIRGVGDDDYFSLWRDLYAYRTAGELRSGRASFP